MALTHTPLYYTYLTDLAPYSDEEFRRLMRSLLRYALKGEEPELPEREALVWPMLRGNAQRAQERYEALAHRRSAAGLRGAEARWNNQET